MAFNRGPNIIRNGLVLALDAASKNSYPGSGTTWTDLSGNNNSGSLVNGPTFDSNNGGSIVLDSTDDKVSLPVGSNFAYGTGDFSVEGWFYQTAIFSAYGDVFFAQTISGTNYFLINAGTAVASNSQPQIVFAFPAGTITSPTLYSLNQWNYFCISRISNVVSIFLNGNSTISSACTFDFTNTTYVPTIGAYTHVNSNNFHGRIAIIRVYKGVGLTATQVSQNFNATKSRFNL
jgi:hypothetical protein